jgi:hypothetical protein
MESPHSNMMHTDHGKILENEIESWHSFGSILRNENRIIFYQMLVEDIKAYSETAKANRIDVYGINIATAKDDK